VAYFRKVRIKPQGRAWDKWLYFDGRLLDPVQSNEMPERVSTGVPVPMMVVSGRASGLSASQPVGLCQATRRSAPHWSHEPEPSCPEMGGHAETSSSQGGWAARCSIGCPSLRERVC
jgi:hypothetical protein